MLLQSKLQNHCTPVTKPLSMTRIFLAFLIACCSFFCSFGQAPALVLTEAQNRQWLDRVSVSPLGTQLRMIRERLLADTNVYVRTSHPDGIVMKDSLANRVYGDGKPLLMVEDVHLSINNRTETKKIAQLAQLLDTRYIESVTLMKGGDPKTMAIYGSAAWSGVIHLKLKEKKEIKKFRRLGLSAWPS